MSAVDISVVVPIYNEAECLPELRQRLGKTLDGLTAAHEIVFVDDGSADASFRILSELHRADHRVRVLRLARNFGHQIAISAGLDRAAGAAVVLMDGDLQDPPEAIPALYAKLKEGHDIVRAIRTTRCDSLGKRIGSRLYHAVFAALSYVDSRPDAGIFRIMSRRAVEAFKDCRETDRDVDALISWTGFPEATVETKHEARFAGKSKYGLVRSVRVAADGILSFSRIPLRLVTCVGLLAALLAVAGGLYLAAGKLFLGNPLPAHGGIVVGLFLVGGAQLLTTGILAEYLGRMFVEVKRRPLYVVRETLGLEERRSP